MILYFSLIVFTKSTHLDVHPLELSSFVRYCLFLVKLFKRVENCWRILSVLVSQIKEIDHLANCGILDDYHMFG